MHQSKKVNLSCHSPNHNGATLDAKRSGIHEQMSPKLASDIRICCVFDGMLANRLRWGHDVSGFKTVGFARGSRDSTIHFYNPLLFSENCYFSQV